MRMTTDSPRKKSGKIVVVSRGSDTRLIRRDPKKGLETRRKLNIPKNRAVLIYTGGLGDEDLENLVSRSLSYTIDKFDAHVIFVIATDMTEHSKMMLKGITDIVAKKDLGANFHLVTNVPYREIYRYLSAADIALLTIDNSLKGYITEKTYDYMAAELPILAKANSNGRLAAFFKNYDVGYFSSDWEEFNKNIDKSFRNMKQFKSKGKRSRDIAESMFSRKNLTDVIENEIRNLL